MVKSGDIKIKTVKFSKSSYNLLTLVFVNKKKKTIKTNKFFGSN